jgi:hypothetical protein
VKTGFSALLVAKIALTFTFKILKARDFGGLEDLLGRLLATET